MAFFKAVLKGTWKDFKALHLLDFAQWTVPEQTDLKKKLLPVSISVG